MVRMKSQAVIFENVMIFAIGMMIFLSCFVVFNLYQSYYISTATEDQLNAIKELVTTNILYLTLKNANSSVTLKIPERVAGKDYIIELSEQGLSIGTDEIKKHSDLFFLNRSYEFSGKIVSTKGKISIYKIDKEIIIM